MLLILPTWISSSPTTFLTVVSFFPLSFLVKTPFNVSPSIVHEPCRGLKSTAHDMNNRQSIGCFLSPHMISCKGSKSGMIAMLSFVGAVRKRNVCQRRNRPTWVLSCKCHKVWLTDSSVPSARLYSKVTPMEKSTSRVRKLLLSLTWNLSPVCSIINLRLSWAASFLFTMLTPVNRVIEYV